MKVIFQKTSPYPHQEVALRETLQRPYVALLMEMGTGKSKVTIDTIAYHYLMKNIEAAVIVAPKSICTTWVKEQLPTHLLDSIERIVVQHGAPSKKLENQLKQFFLPSTRLKILVINVDAVITDRGFDTIKKVLDTYASILIIDESTTIKNHKSLRTKLLTKLGEKVKFKRILTGTPFSNSPMDAFAQFNFLNKNIFPGGFFPFRNKYAVLMQQVTNGRTFQKIVGYKRLDDLKSIIDAHSFKVLKKDCLSLPSKTYEVRYIELTPKQKHYYETLKKQTFVELEFGQLVSAPLMITRMLRLRQAICNIVPTEEGNSLIDTNNPRINEILHILEEAGNQKAIIWSSFTKAIDNIYDEISKVYGKEACAIFDGRTSQEDRQNLVSAFQTGEKLRYLIMNPKVGGSGITLTAATIVIYHDNDWSLETRLQSEDRAHRIGQTNPVTYIDLLVENSLDERVYTSFIKKADLSSKITGSAVSGFLRSVVSPSKTPTDSEDIFEEAPNERDNLDEQD